MHTLTPRSRAGLAVMACLLLAAPAAVAQTVAKTVNMPTTFQARALWTIDKTVDVSQVELSCNQAIDVNYEVTVIKVGQAWEHHVDGTITVTNTTGGNVTLTDLEDFMRATSDAGYSAELEVTCPVTFPHVMAPGAVLNCTYAGRPFEPSNTVVLNRNEAIGTFSGIGPISSGQVELGIPVIPATTLDRCIQVDDDLEGDLGTWCFDTQGTVGVFNYTGTIGPFGASGVYPVVNVASFYGLDSGPGGAPEIPGSSGSATGEDEATVTATVECDGGGCSLTIGYWKTHSSYGPAAHPDPTWEELPGGDGPDTAFLNSGLTWYQMFQLSSTGGNAYVKLAQQWMGATLNVMAGADGGVLGTVLADAQALMTANPGCLTNPRTCPNGVKTQMNQWAEILDAYNNGVLPGGPDHCDGQEAPGANALVGDGSAFALGTPAPNPTNGAASIYFDVPEASQVRLVAYDVMGREVARLADDYYEAGTHEVVFEGAYLPAGTYFIRMSAGEFHDVTRVVLAR